jgi:hypothetical protein
MKFCICNPDMSFRHFQTVDSVHIMLNRKVLDYLPRDKELIVDIHFIVDEELIIKDIEKYQDFNNVIFAIPWKDRETIIPFLKKMELKWMFSTFCNSKDMLSAQLEYSPAYVTITEELGFELKSLSSLKIPIRVLANIAQCAKGTREINPETKFFIRPEDIKFYEGIVDTVELVAALPDRLSVVYEIYKNGVWLGPINELIGDLNLNIMNNEFPPGFGENRLNCHKQCIYNKCHLCHRYIETSKIFNKAGIKTVTPKEKVMWDTTPKTKGEKNG